jgi:hypothetical protein
MIFQKNLYNIIVRIFEVSTKTKDKNQSIKKIFIKYSITNYLSKRYHI